MPISKKHEDSQENNLDGQRSVQARGKIRFLCVLNCAFKFKMKYPWSWQVHYWKTRLSRPPGQWASRCVLSKSLSVVCEWRYPLDHRNTIISTHWHHSALHSSSATPLHGSHTQPPTSCSTIIVFSVQPIVCAEARWTMSPISVQDHDPTLLLWPVFFQLNRTRWCSRVIRGGGSSVLPGTGVENVRTAQIINLWRWCSHWEDMWTGSVHNTLWGCHRHVDLSTDSEFYTVEVKASLRLDPAFPPPAWSQDTYPIYNFSGTFPSNLDYSFSLFYQMETASPHNCWIPKPAIVMLWLCYGRQMDGRLHTALICAHHRQVSDCFYRGWDGAQDVPALIIVVVNRKITVKIFLNISLHPAVVFWSPTQILHNLIRSGFRAGWAAITAMPEMQTFYQPYHMRHPPVFYLDPSLVQRRVLDDQVELWWSREPRHSMLCYCASVALIMALGLGGVGLLSTNSLSGEWRLGVGTTLCLLALAVLLKQLLSSAIQDMNCVHSRRRIDQLKSGGRADPALILAVGLAVMLCGTVLLCMATIGSQSHDSREMLVSSLVLMAAGTGMALAVVVYSVLTYLKKRREQRRRMLLRVSRARTLGSRAVRVFSVSGGQMSQARREATSSRTSLIWIDSMVTITQRYRMNDEVLRSRCAKRKTTIWIYYDISILFLGCWGTYLEIVREQNRLLHHVHQQWLSSPMNTPSAVSVTLYPSLNVHYEAFNRKSLNVNLHSLFSGLKTPNEQTVTLAPLLLNICGTPQRSHLSCFIQRSWDLISLWGLIVYSVMEVYTINISEFVLFPV